MLLKCELMLLKFQINTNTNKNGFRKKRFKKGIEILILSFNYLNGDEGGGVYPHHGEKYVKNCNLLKKASEMYYLCK